MNLGSYVVVVFCFKFCTIVPNELTVMKEYCWLTWENATGQVLEKKLF